MCNLDDEKTNLSYFLVKLLSYVVKLIWLSKVK